MDYWSRKIRMNRWPFEGEASDEFLDSHLEVINCEGKVGRGTLR